jgi:starch synthase (maltosyl-transferring)
VNSGTTWTPGPRIYNLFPLLAGPLPAWNPHLERAQRLGFNWLFINAFQLSGYSGSLYSIKDHYAIDPRLLDPAAGPPMGQLQQMIRRAHELGLSLMMDLVINHTAFDSPLVNEHPAWFKRSADGKPLNPGAKEDDRWVTWRDLFEVDNGGSPDRDALWNYWLGVAEHYAALGFDGFRCDAAYKVPDELWRFLFGGVKRAHPNTLFFAESLGCPIEDTVRLAQSGFNFIFNSSKWWDFYGPWCLDQYRRTAEFCPSISFPESHDTERLAAELDGDKEAVKMRYGFSALFSTGVMMPIGFEYGFRRRLDVVKTQPSDWEPVRWDLSDFIGAVNRLKGSMRAFNEEGPVGPIDVGNPNLFVFVKSTRDRSEKALVLLNKDRQSQQSFSTARLGSFFAGTGSVQDVSPDGPLQHTPDMQTCHLKPSGINVLYARAAR